MEKHLDLIAQHSKKIIALLVFTGLFSAYDLYDDWVDNEPLSHIFGEFLCSFIPLMLSWIIWRSAFNTFENSRSLFNDRLEQARLEAEKWKADAKILTQGVSQAIDAQFDRWKLTAAEKEVGLLLIKGLSYAEISSVRETTERTVREQTSTIFKKSKLTSRAQLAAFFLEDLLAATQNK